MNERVCLVIPSFRGGGAERATVSLANGLALAGLCVDLVVVSAEGPYRAEVDIRVNLIDLDARRLIAGVPRLVKYLRQYHPGTVCAVMTQVGVVVYIAIKLSRHKARFFISERNYPISALKKRNLVRELVVNWMARAAYAEAERVIAVSDDLADVLAAKLRLKSDKLCVIKNGVDLSKIDALSSDQAPQAITEFIRDRKMVLAVGRLVDQKDYSTLLKAFSKVSQVVSSVLIVLGEGPLRQRLESEAVGLGISDLVIFPGFLPNPFPVMMRADTFVLSSRWEGFPNVIIQAMACDIPVVATDCPTGPSEILDGGRYGRLVAVGDVSALAQEVIASLTAPKLRISRQRAAEFSMDDVINQYQSLFSRGALDD
jgi:glycosyltransferase involved in cell wall biosynthesis